MQKLVVSLFMRPIILVVMCEISSVNRWVFSLSEYLYMHGLLNVVSVIVESLSQALILQELVTFFLHRPLPKPNHVPCSSLQSKSLVKGIFSDVKAK